MPYKTEFANREVFWYARLLLAERREQFRTLQEPTSGDRTLFLSCRRSLEQAIYELETLLHGEAE